MRCVASLPLFLTLALAALAPAGTKVKIDTVPAEYRPDIDGERIESKPVSMDHFYFEVNRKTVRARIVVYIPIRMTCLTDPMEILARNQP
jgi:hypothetical protein